MKQFIFATVFLISFLALPAIGSPTDVISLPTSSGIQYLDAVVFLNFDDIADREQVGENYAHQGLHFENGFKVITMDRSQPTQPNWLNEDSLETWYINADFEFFEFSFWASCNDALVTVSLHSEVNGTGDLLGEVSLKKVYSYDLFSQYMIRSDLPARSVSFYQSRVDSTTWDDFRFGPAQVAPHDSVFLNFDEMEDQSKVKELYAGDGLHFEDFGALRGDRSQPSQPNFLNNPSSVTWSVNADFEFYEFSFWASCNEADVTVSLYTGFGGRGDLLASISLVDVLSYNLFSPYVVRSILPARSVFFSQSRFDSTTWDDFYFNTSATVEPTTTESPSTAEPTSTLEPTKLETITETPTTHAPTTHAPTTHAPTNPPSSNPTTATPTTHIPTSPATTTPQLSTEAPTTSPNPPKESVTTRGVLTVSKRVTEEEAQQGLAKVIGVNETRIQINKITYEQAKREESSKIDFTIKEGGRGETSSYDLILALEKAVESNPSAFSEAGLPSPKLEVLEVAVPFTQTTAAQRVSGANKLAASFVLLALLLV